MMEHFPGGMLARVESQEALWFFGDVYKVVVDGNATGGAYALLEIVIRPGSGAPPHVHTQESEFFYLLEGQMEFHVGERTLRAGPGDFVQVLPGEVHYFVNPTENPTRALVGITPAKFIDFFRDLGVPVGESSVAPPPPALEVVIAAAARYGVTILPPGR